MRYYNDDYVVNEYGELYSLFGFKLRKLKPYKNKRGYLMYRLRLNGKTVHKSAHHLSYWVNIGKFDTSDGLQIDHIDGNKLNNHYTNLRRVTPRDNANNINTMGKLKPKSRSNYRLNPTDKLPEIIVKSPVYNKELHPNRNTRKVINSSGSVSYVKSSNCTQCGKQTSGKFCVDCYKMVKSEHIPSREELIKDLLTKEPLVKLASKHNISDNAYRKWLTKRGLPSKLKDIKLFLLSV